MATTCSAEAEGRRRSRLLRQRVGGELEVARLAVGLSLRELGRRLGVSPQRVARAERGDPAALTLDLAARMAEILGLRLAGNLYPNGDPVRDRGHLALVDRFRRRLPSTIRLRVEVPIPIAGDLRSGDGWLDLAGSEGDVGALIEAETRLGDLQLVERRARAKARDLDAARLTLLVADTRHNREVLQLHPELIERFPISARRCLAALAQGRDPGGDAMVVL